MNEQNQSHKIFKSIQKQLTAVLLAIFLVTLAVNLWLLADIGTRGEQLSSIRKQQDQQKIQNDLLRSELEGLRVSSQIEKKAREQLKLSDKAVTVIDLNTDQVSAQNENN